VARGRRADAVPAPGLDALVGPDDRVRADRLVETDLRERVARERDLDSKVIALGPGAAIDAHAGPDVDVLIHVLAGSGQLSTELDTVPLCAGSLTWLPRRSRRQFTVGPDGLRYLTVHKRRQALTPPPAPAADAAE
jgi:quercetin dioxygenase-like cupin family protein